MPHDNSISITSVVENTCLRHGLLAQHGQSLLLNYHGTVYLYDTGEIFSGLSYNLSVMRIPIPDIDSIIISHRHGDHCGALVDLLPSLRKQVIYFPNDRNDPDLKTDAEKYKFTHMDSNGSYNVAIAESNFNKIESYPHTIIVDNSIEIEPGLYVTGPIGNRVREQAIVINLMDKGILVIVGCSHPGLEMIINKAMEITKNNKLYGLIGGFHFKDMGQVDLKKQVEILRSFDPSFIVPSHCTGNEAIQFIKREFGNKAVTSGTGSLGVGNTIHIVPHLQFNFV